MFGNWITKGLALACAGLLLAGCTDDVPTGAELSGLQEHGLTLSSLSEGATAQLLVTGLEELQGSAIGPDGALYVTAPLAGSIWRVDRSTGEVTLFASGLPARIPDPFFLGSGVVDVAFIGGTSYALVTGVGPDLEGDDVVGIYRVDGPHSFTVIADIGAFSIANPPATDFVVPTGFQYALDTLGGEFLVTDGHHNRVLRVTRAGEITELIAFGNVVPTGLDVRGRRVFLAQAGPIPHEPEDGKVVSFEPDSPIATEVASGAPLLVDVEFGPGGALFALSQGVWDGPFEGAPALPNTGALVRAIADGAFSVVTEGLDRPTSLEFIGNTAYIVTLTGEIWTIDLSHHSAWSPATSIEDAPPGAHDNFNTAFLDGCPFPSRDGKMFFIASTRPGGLGGIDIWVSIRASVNDPWGEPVNVGAPINSEFNDFCPTLAPDGHTFFFVSNRPGGLGGSDIYVTRLRDGKGFDAPQNLWRVNSAADEASPFPLHEPGVGPVLYFSSTRPGGFAPEAPDATVGDSDIYRSVALGRVFGPPELVPGVNSASEDGHPNVRRDGLEIFFFSNRPGDEGLGMSDIYAATRARTSDPWSIPVNLGPNVNSAAAESRPSLSWDGTTLYFGSTRPEGEGSTNSDVTTRQ
ncbi:MAG: ScyD/ScyE family protein [Gemmatimonadetes bacterium]|nr:ScyD/ScyE family protein [Gemmatimonadota bacterium]MBA3895129.1 ScyD/ScyE family protein [Gemmatimonadales bacterium]